MGTRKPYICTLCHYGKKCGRKPIHDHCCDAFHPKETKGKK